MWIHVSVLDVDACLFERTQMDLVSFFPSFLCPLCFICCSSLCYFGLISLTLCFHGFFASRWQHVNNTTCLISKKEQHPLSNLFLHLLQHLIHSSFSAFTLIHVNMKPERLWWTHYQHHWHVSSFKNTSCHCGGYSDIMQFVFWPPEGDKSAQTESSIQTLLPSVIILQI